MSNPIVPFGEEAVKSELRELVGKPSRKPSTPCSTRRSTSWWALRPTSEPTGGRRTAPGTMSAYSPRRRARPRSRCQSSRGCASRPRSSNAWIGYTKLDSSVRAISNGESYGRPKHPRHFSDDFKWRIVELHNAGKPMSEIMAEYGLGRSTVRR